MKSWDFIEKAYDYIKKNGYVKNETQTYINDNFDSLPSSRIGDFLEWAKSNNGKSDYYDTLNILLHSSLEQPWQYNTVCSALNIYFKQLRAQEERDNSPSTYQGAIGEKVTFVVKEMRAISYGNFDSTFYRIVGTDDNIYMWSTSKYFEIGDTIIGTVRDHREYKGEKQTIITRGKIVDRESSVEA